MQAPTLYLLAIIDTWQDIEKTLETYLKAPTKPIFIKPDLWQVCSPDNKPFGKRNHYFIERDGSHYNLKMQLLPLPQTAPQPQEAAA